MRPKGTAESFSVSKDKYRLTDSLDLGLRTVTVKNIVGSVNRWRDFDARFRIKNPSSKHRYQRIKRAVERGEILPPVILYKVGEKYYVVDGNHRVSVAKEVGQTYIDAEVIEFFPPADSEFNLIWRERSVFEMKTGLDEIVFTELGAYDKLLMQIEDFRREESATGHYELSLKEASAHWEQDIYKPVAALIKKQGLLEDFPNRTEADLFLYASYHKVAKSRLTQEKISYRQALEDFKIEQPGRSFTEQLVETISGLFAPDGRETCPQGLILDEDGLVRITQGCRDSGRCEHKRKARHLIPPHNHPWIGL